MFEDYPKKLSTEQSRQENLGYKCGNSLMSSECNLAFSSTIIPSCVWAYLISFEYQLCLQWQDTSQTGALSVTRFARPLFSGDGVGGLGHCCEQFVKKFNQSFVGPIFLIVIISLKMK